MQQDLYSIAKRLAGKFAKPERPVRDKNGGVITDDEGRKKRWIEHIQIFSTGQFLRTHK
ncbi:hypothetical protein DPMN_189213 [Dreissena polymorpha]|uniref:Uncharacterized protein n=1 Tax=Dreissena polymorpha TaxID=45954 RepID=A0A9D4DV41_DREPO|nr:hypothetical protein DPMN_189213 [Dreissena polymorpha]